MKNKILPTLFAVLAYAALFAVYGYGANTTIKDIPTTSVLPATNDFMVQDGATYGTRKLAATRLTYLTATRTSLAALSITGAADGTGILVLGASAAGDGGGASYFWSAGSSATPNGDTVIQPASLPATGRWLKASGNVGTPGVATLGGVFSNVGAANKFVSSINTDGTVTLTQPSAAMITGLGTMASQNATAVAITGGAIDGTPIGATTPSIGRFSSGTITSSNVGSTNFTIANTSGLGRTWIATVLGSGAGSPPPFSFVIADSTAGTNPFIIAPGTGIVTHTFGTNTPKLTNLTSNGIVFTNAGNGTLFTAPPSDVVVTAYPSSILPRSLGNRFGEVINALDYGADNTGANDNTSALNFIIAQARSNDGTIPEVLLNRYIAGFTTPPSNTWTGRPSITMTGGLSGSTGFQGWGNINPGGYMVNVEVANKGTGYNILTYVCNRTNGSPVVTLSSGTFDARIVAGVAVRFESVTTSCRVLTRDSNTQLTLTENMTFTNADEFVFGMPVPLINGSGAPNDIIPVVGTARKVYFPPGSYKLTGSWPSMGGLSNVSFEATGAQFLYTSNTTGFIGIRNSTAINWNGGDFMYQGARFSVPTTRSRYPGQEGFAVGGSQYVNVSNVTTWSAFEFGFVAGGDGSTNAYWGQRITFDGCRAITPLGDGFHVTTGNQWVRIINCVAIQPGDDALACVNDWDVPARSPTDVEFIDCRIDGGLYRGCVALGSNYVRFINITGRDTHGPFLWALPDGAFDAPSYVTFENITADNIGNTAFTAADSNSGIGIRADAMTGLRLRNLSFKQDPTVAGTNPVWLVVESGIAQLDWPGRKIQSISPSGTLAGTLNTDLPCLPGNGFAAVSLELPHRYKVTGTITARSSTGSFGQIWAVLYDPATGTEYGGGSSLQWTDIAERNILSAEAIIEVQGIAKTICFKLKQGGGGCTLDAGTTSGPNSEITAIQID